MKINILGTEWTLLFQTEEDEPRLNGKDGFCDVSTRTLVIEKNMQGELGDMDCYRRHVLRHEIIHAFLFECGIWECSHSSGAWTQNEEMVDWLAHQGPKIYKAWQDAGAL